MTSSKIPVEFGLSINNIDSLSFHFQELCMSCRGSGIVEGVKDVKVTIPAGWLQKSLWSNEVVEGIIFLGFFCAANSSSSLKVFVV